MAGSRNWADLPDEPTGLIAERVLAYDVVDCLRFRAACPAWQRCSVDPRAHGSLDRRFHPRRWTMLREEHAVPTRRSFLNTSTGECVQVKIPQLLDHHALALTPEGLLLLLDKPQRTAVRLLNPFTGQLTELPPFNTLLPHIAHYQQRDDDDFARIMTAWGSGLADDGSTVVLYLRNHHLIGIAKPGDDRWSLLRLRDNMLGKANIMFAGRFYCVTQDGVMVLQIDEGHPPRLEVAANLNMDVLLSVDYMHLVDNCGELMLVHRQRRDKHSNPTNKFNMWRRRYDTYRVDLDSRTLIPVKSFGGKGRAVFMGMYCSFSVSIESFPAGSVSADTIYLSFDFGETEYANVGAYHLTSGCLGRNSRRWGGLVPRPYTLVDCLSFSNTLEYSI
uniref:KIB1-4 beta-propeller domain-containing protein n=1 Tax=Hordeum vulgare subsp. vulgare TaxID=112509 RepID=A0A8I6XKD1_HORVV